MTRITTVHTSYQAAVEAAKTTKAPAIYAHYNRHSSRVSDKWRVVAIDESGKGVSNYGFGVTRDLAIADYVKMNQA